MLDLALQRNAQLADYQNPKFSNISHYDSVHGTEYLPTLRAYIESRYNPLVASRMLSVHRNTVDYRIGRIQELFGIDTNDAEELFELQVSFKIQDYLDVQSSM